ncbi:Tic20 family protein [Coleofasciculus sp. H7-2]|uniref:Tic20 family protein n=1 Tax=Coleofasciculus sp. H7-2 TaxID=3351545 RepID=UPI0036728D53
MTWRGSATTKDRIFACLPYLLPLLSVLPFGAYLFRQFPVLALILLPLQPLLAIYTIPFASLIIFFVLFLGVVRNEKISHFIRFNTMQALLIDIALFLCTMVLSILTPALGTGLVGQTLFNVVFLGTLAACAYSVVQSVLGRYAEIPGISEAVYSQVP